MLNVLNRHNTLYNFYHSTKHLISPKNDFNYISKPNKEYNLYNTILYNHDKKNNIKTNNKNRLTYNSSNRHLNYLNTKEVKTTTNNKITNITSVNFWKDNTKDKYNYNTYNINSIKNDRDKDKDITSPEEKFKINSKLFELFINDYEKRIKKSLAQMGASALDINNNKNNKNSKNKNNMNENEKNSNNDYETYQKNFFNLPFLNNNDEINNNENDKNNCFSSMNENNNEIYKKEPNNNRIQSAIKEKLIKANSFQRNKIKEEIKDLNKKIRTFSSSPFTINTTINNRNKDNKISHYEIGKVIGKGAYASVKICKNKITQEKFAMKIYEKKILNDNIKKKCILREIEILKKLNHPNIVKLYDTIISDKNILLIQELVNGISLRDFYNKEIRNQKNISEKKYKILTLIFKQIFSAFDYIHKKKYISSRYQIRKYFINKKLRNKNNRFRLRAL